MKRLLQFVLTALPALLCMTLIFTLSAEPASASSDTSAGFIEWFLDTFVAKFRDASPDKQQSIIDSCQFFARKAAHFSLYALLGILWCPPMYTLTFSGKKAAWFAWLITALYAVTDEIHQKFVPGRSGEVRDIFIDSAGAALSVMLVYTVLRKILSKRTTE